MKKLLFLAVVMGLATSSAWSIGENMSAGPGGRIYITHWYDDGAGSTYRKVYSLGFGTAWTVTAPNQLHGMVLDNHPGLVEPGSVYPNKDLPLFGSPEIELSAANPQTGYADLIMGLANNTPRSPTSVFALGAVTNLVRVTPSSGSIGTVTQFGTGKAGGGTDCNTDGLNFGLVDPVGGFTGAAGRYLMGGTNAANQTGGNLDYKILKTVSEAGDGDPTDDDSDYLVVDIRRGVAEIDGEIYGGKFFYNVFYHSFGGFNALDGIFYNDAGDGYTQKAWYANPPIGPAAGPSVQQVAYAGGIAVGYAKDDQGVKHTAVWSHYGTRSDIWAFVDWNNDGDAMDNAQVTGFRDEYFRVYDGADLGYGPDMEFVEGAGSNFLFRIASQAGVNFPYITVYQLADNGELMGGLLGASVWRAHLSLKDASNLNILPGIANFSFEVDYGQFYVIPEPGTLLLLGPGALGALGYMRRRRLS